MWVYNFIKRLPEGFSWVKQKPAERERVEAEDISILPAWYDRLEPFVRRISPSNIYNFDETGFALGQGKPQKVISHFRERTRMLPGERGELLTGIECIAADGWFMEPYFVAPGLVHLDRWYEGGTLSEKSRIAVSSLDIRMMSSLLIGLIFSRNTPKIALMASSDYYYSTVMAHISPGTSWISVISGILSLSSSLRILRISFSPSMAAHSEP